MRRVYCIKISQSAQGIAWQLASSNKQALTTLLTELSRLAEKGFLKISKDGRSNLYTPLISREAYLAAQSKSFVDTLCGGSMTIFANALCDSGISKEDLEELTLLLQDESRHDNDGNNITDMKTPEEWTSELLETRICRIAGRYSFSSDGDALTWEYKSPKYQTLLFTMTDHSLSFGSQKERRHNHTMYWLDT